MADEDEFIPEVFRTPLLSDQTFRYHKTITLRLPLETDSNNRVAYLSMLSADEKLVPVGWGNINHSKHEIIFEQVPLNTLFFPVCYDADYMLPISEPFIIYSTSDTKTIPNPLTSNELPRNIIDASVVDGKLSFNTKLKELDMKYLTLSCDTSQKVKLHLLRKYPEKRRIKTLHEKLKGACFLGAIKNGATLTHSIF